LQFINELKKNYSDKKILVVAHGGILKLMYLLFKKEKMDHVPKNTFMYEFYV